ncbi:hypothetical protein DFQ28_002198 [Apophysomyces sp. BC1034]|nr:hypothetical protein DFQ30_002730 [Apophysomyces sp. BC1015]KAG0179828.1 hypothetical protein DFQ29_001592 [Apophysomyces sp. BC1021]KAG0190313.1 hypothetical protein DFQ28_002198 [Apophysomyces sp. BC1034]
MDQPTPVAEHTAAIAKQTDLIDSQQPHEPTDSDDRLQKLQAQQIHLKDMRERLALYKTRHEAALQKEERREKEEAEQNRRLEEERQRLEAERQESQSSEEKAMANSTDNTMLVNMFGLGQNNLAAQFFSGNNFGIVTEREAIDWLRADAHKQ